MDEITVINRPSAFNHLVRELRIIPHTGKNLLQLKNECMPTGVSAVVSVNGKIIPEESLELSVPNIGDCIVFTPKLEYEGAAAAAYWVGAALVAYAGVTLAAALVIGYMLTVIFYAAIMIGMGMLINALFAPDLGDLGGSGTGAGSSQLYSWNPSTTNKQGGMVPRLYGECRAYGNTISIYSESFSEKSYLNILISLGIGPISELSDFRINDQDGKLFDNVVFEARYGHIGQFKISNFNDTKQEYSMARIVTKASPIEYITEHDDYDGLEVDISFPKGLFYMSDNGITTGGVTFTVEAISIDDPNTIIPMAFCALSRETVLAGYWSIGAWITPSSEDYNTWGYNPPGVDVWTEVGPQDKDTVYENHVEGGTIAVTLENRYIVGYDGQGNHVYASYPYIQNAIYRWVETGTTVHKVQYPYGRVLNQTTSPYAVTYRIKVPKKGRYKIKVSKTSPDYNNVRYGDQVSLSVVREVYNDDFSYPRHVLVGIRALASDQLSGSLGFSCLVKGGLIRVYNGTTWAIHGANTTGTKYNNPAWVCYDVLSQPVFHDASYVAWVNTAYTSVPSDAKFNISWFRCKLTHTSIPATRPPMTTYWQAADGPTNCDVWAVDVIHNSGDYVLKNTYLDHWYSKVFRCIAAHKSSAITEPLVGAYWAQNWVECTWYGDYRTYNDISTANAAGPLRYDGIDPSKLDHAAFKLWADFCDVLVADGVGGTEKRFTFNGGFDSEASLWEAAFKVCQMSRAALYWNGNQISVIIDQATTATQLFTSGNIVADSFEETFLPYEDRAGEIEIDFMNEEMDYERDTFTIFNAALDKPTSKASLQLIGCTRPSQAWRSGQFLLLCNLYLKRVIKFTADIDAIACTIGDVINFQHDVPKWGLAGGRIVSATPSTVTLDTEVTIEAGKTYAIMIRLSTDVLLTNTISGAMTPGVHTVLTLSIPFATTPAQYDIYSFGESGIVTKPFRVQSLEKAQDQKIVLSCIEYDANVYTVDTGTPLLPTVNYSAVSPVSAVTGLTLTEEICYNEMGMLARDIIVRFSKSSNPLNKNFIIYYIETGFSIDYTTGSIIEPVVATILQTAGGLIRAGETTGTSFRIPAVKPLTTYYVFVQSESFSGILLPVANWPRATLATTNNEPTVDSNLIITVRGLEIDGQGLNHNFPGKHCRLCWDALLATGNSPAGTEVAGAGSSSPNTALKDYEVKVYWVVNGAEVLRRTEHVTSPNYTYTYDKNLEDGITAEFIVGVTGRTWRGTASAAEARLTAKNSIPAVISGLSSVSTVGGVQFSWSQNQEEDLQGYLVKTKVGGGAYSAETKITDNKLVRVMTAAEIAAYGSNAMIYCSIKVIDLFQQQSPATEIYAKANVISDNIFQLVPSLSLGSGDVTELYNGITNSGGVTI